MKTALIITTYNWPEALELVLNSILNQTYLPDEVIIADDGSSKKSVDKVQKLIGNYPIKIKYIYQEDKGFRAAMIRNKAVAASESEYIIGIDGDILLHKNFIEDHLKMAQKNRYIQGRRVLLTNQKTQEIFNSQKIKFSFFDNGIRNRKNTIHSKFLSKLFSKTKNTLKGIKTCNFSMYKEDIIKINGFDNDFVGWGREDSEFVARFLNNGGKRFDIRFNAIAYHIYHKENTRKNLKSNDKKLEDTIKNKIIFCKNGIDKFIK